MVRLPIIFIFMIWLSRTMPETGASSVSVIGLAICMGMLAAAILSVGLYSRATARWECGVILHRRIRRINQIVRLAKYVVPAWFAVLVYLLDYSGYVHGTLGPLERWPLETPAFVLGTLPAMLAWVGVWWASYPTDRALREQHLMIRIDSALPARIGPSLWQCLLANTRLQLLFIYAPILCILALRDLATVGLRLGGVPVSDLWQLGISVIAMAPVMLAAPILLVRILPTQRLSDSPLRQKLEDLCRRNGLKVSKILLWQTDSTIANAAVMGLLPRMRYLLVTDLVLETMSDEQVLAVFAHEVGHVVHKHLLWMVACGFAIMFCVGGPGEMLVRILEHRLAIPSEYGDLAALLVAAPLFLLAFGLVVRRLERQADVFAARALPQLTSENPSDASPLLNREPVRSSGASAVCEALYQIAMVNNIPLSAGEWLHGSIAWRMAFLRSLGDMPERTNTFDRQMRWLYTGIILATLVMGLWTVYNGV